MMRAKHRNPPPHETLEQRCKRGDKSAIIPAVNRFLMLNEEAVPEWLLNVFSGAYMRALEYEIHSWDEVFGPPLPKGRSRRAALRQLKLDLPIYERVEELSAAGHRRDKALFEQVGEEFGISSTLASNIYYENRDLNDFSHPGLRRTPRRKLR
jgi:hypothetical protein